MSVFKVLMVDSEREWRGGQEQIRLLMRGLCERGVEVALAAPRDSALLARAAELDVTRIGCDIRSRGPAGVLSMRRLLRAGAWDIVHSHASRAHSTVALARIGLKPRAVHVVSRRVQSAMKREPLARWKYRRGADAYIAISERIRELLLAGGIPAARVHVAHSGIDLAKFATLRDAAAVRSELGCGPGDELVGTVGALTPEKAHADLLRAAERVLARRPRVRFIMVGDGPLRAVLERQAEAGGIAGQVTWTGFRPDALDLLGAFDVFVMCSTQEGLGTSIMDAQAAGVAVVATRTGGIPEIVTDGTSGLLVPAGAPELLAAAIERLLTEPELRAGCISGGRERAAGYDYRHMVHKTLDVYRRLCDKSDLPSTKDAIA
ncbi:MAG TPA: glycosyltransferase [Candidatus Krumholzibacteria bacterium]|nr:glycosyltransferase [Candidatus Krumholzibacteria bacterium]